MKKLVCFLMIALLFASCGSSNSFSKRQHLKGHFWKKSGGKRSISKHKTEEKSNNTFEVSIQEELEENVSTIESVSSADEQIIDDEIIKDQNLEKSIQDDAMRSITPKFIESKPIKTSSKEASISQASSKSQRMDRIQRTKLLWGVWITVGVIGLTLIVLSFVLSAELAIVAWLLPLGLTFIGLFILFALLVLLWALASFGG